MSESQTEKCPICMETLPSEPSLVVSCPQNHTYCSECIDIWEASHHARACFLCSSPISYNTTLSPSQISTIRQSVILPWGMKTKEDVTKTVSFIHDVITNGFLSPDQQQAQAIEVVKAVNRVLGFLKVLPELKMDDASVIAEAGRPRGLKDAVMDMVFRHVEPALHEEKKEEGGED